VYAFGGAGQYSGAGVYTTGGNSLNSTIPAAPGLVAIGGAAPPAPGPYGPGGSGPGGIFHGGGAFGDSQPGGDGLLVYPGSDGGLGIYALGLYQVAALLDGNVEISGNVSKASGSFWIDHPLDPANKYLYHSFVESPDMMNVYNGNVVTDGGGNATVTLPEWFEALNRDYRYQLTTIGQPAHAWIAAEILNNRFTIRTDKPNVKVSWQVTGIRQDAWANAHRIPVEVQKAQADQGHYLHPELFEHAGEPNIPQLHHPLPKLLEQQQQTQRH
jgi:hypothetical protein